MLAGGSSVPLISERKGTDPHWKHVAARCPVSGCWPSWFSCYQSLCI